MASSVRSPCPRSPTESLLAEQLLLDRLGALLQRLVPDEVGRPADAEERQRTAVETPTRELTVPVVHGPSASIATHVRPLWDLRLTDTAPADLAASSQSLQHLLLLLFTDNHRCCKTTVLSVARQNA
jgi:hypothetical protein